MHRAAYHTVHVHAQHGYSQQLGQQLADTVELLNTLPGCIGFYLVHSEQDANLWQIHGHWQSEAAMQAHFRSPLTQRITTLIEQSIIRRIDFQSGPEALAMATRRALLPSHE
jgi:quinol monooxygenase YgiN